MSLGLGFKVRGNMIECRRSARDGRSYELRQFSPYLIRDVLYRGLVILKTSSGKSIASFYPVA